MNVKGVLLVVTMLTVSLLGFGQSNDNLKVQNNSNGDTYSFGVFEGKLILPNGEEMGNSSNWYEQLFLTKMDPEGNIIWSRYLAGVAAVYTGYGAPGIGMAVDDMDNVYITASFVDSLMMDEETTLYDEGFSEMNTTISRMFVAKYDGEGNLKWAKTPSQAAESYGVDIGLDQSANLYLTGWYRLGEFAFDSLTALDYSRFVSGNYDNDVFVAKLDSSGAALWQKSVLGGNKDVHDILISPEGDSYIFGDTHSDGQLVVDDSTVSFDDDIFLMKFNPEGITEWFHLAECPEGNTYFEEFALDSAGDLIGIGHFENYVDFGNQVKLTKGPGKSDLFLVRYDSEEGIALSAQRSHTNPEVVNSAVGMSLKSSVFNEIVFATRVITEAEFPPLDPIEVSSRGGDVLVKFEPDGQTASCQKWMNGYNVFHGIEDIAIDLNGNVYSIGNADGKVIRIEKTSRDCTFEWGVDFQQETMPFSVGDQPTSQQIKLIPNPNEGAFSLVHDLKGEGQLKIYNQIGQIVYSRETIQGSNLHINLSLSPGIYTVVIEEANVRHSEKLVVY